MTTFVGRKLELQMLESAYMNKNAFVMINGRRRVGKTSLVKYFLSTKRAVYFSAMEEVDSLNRRHMMKTIANYLGEEYNERNMNSGVQEWKDIFKRFAEKGEPGRKVLVLDNVGYLIQANPDFPKILKHAWEHYFKLASVMLIVVMPNNSILVDLESRSSSLIGAVTHRLRLHPVSYVEMLRDYHNNDFIHLMNLYAITGGVPIYWSYFGRCSSLQDILKVVERVMLTPTGALFDEPMHLLEKDVWEPVSYNSVMQIIAMGCIRPADMAKALGLRSKDISRILDNLESLGYVEAFASITDKKGTSSRRVHYHISDPMMAFWYNFVYPHRTELESGDTKRALEHIETMMPKYTQHWFKMVSMEIFSAACRQGNLTFTIDQMGPFWNKKEESIDIVAVDETRKRIFFGDCRFGDTTYTMKDYRGFVSSCEVTKDFKAYRDYERIYGVFAVAPFELSLMDFASITKDVILFNGITIYSKENH